MTQSMIFYRANCCGNEKNCSYPNRMEVSDVESFRQVVRYDYVCARYRDSYCSTANFDGSNVACTDFDNDHSDNPSEWITPEYVAQIFHGVPLAIHYSRNHMKPKNGKAARPKFHAAFLTDPVYEADDYKVLVKRLHDYFPYFDTNAMDAARFFFGTATPQVEFHPGSMTLNAFLNELLDEPETDEEFRRFCESEDTIPQGSRNATMSHFAGRVLKRFGDTDAAYELFQKKASQCDPPLEDEELNTIWQSARRFFSRVSQQAGYVPPDQYNSNSFLYKPDDCTDVGQARLLGKFFSSELRYSPSTDYLRYTGVYWQETKPGAQAVAHALTDLQLKEAQAAVEARTEAYEATGASEIMASAAKKKAITMLSPEQLYAYERYIEAVNYKTYALQRRESKYISAALHEAHPVLEIDPNVLDKDWFLLCTPEATYDLRKGLDGRQDHNPEDYCTHVTAVSPGDKGKGIWKDALDVFFQQDEELIRYVQRVAGVCCVGQVFWEAMIIAYGDGRNGKSTFWNSLARVLGGYSGNISADSLTVGCKRNVKPEMAEARGKRLLIAAELEEGTRLNTSTVKQLCSTDNVFAEKKYKDPFSYTPSHTLVLYTNHLPKVGATDTGIWRRLVVIPFNAKIQGKGDIKNFTDYLVTNAGEAIMAWMIEGARQAIELGFKIPLPRCVEQAINAYKEQNDWLGHFLTERCEIEDGAEEKSGVLYNAYRAHCAEANEYTRSTTDFYTALEAEGFMRHKTKKGAFVRGVRLKPDQSNPEEEFQDFLK